MNFYLGLDVGGTNIKSGVVLENSILFNDNINMCQSLAKEDKETILNNIFNVIKREFDSYKEGKLLGIAIGFPGPFDYEKGICKIQNINKYDSIYNVNIREEILKFINNNYKKENLHKDFNILFENDATLFTLGETEQNIYLKKGKYIGICIGTGCGSTLLQDNKVLKHIDSLTNDGFIYHLPFKDSIVDDYISARGIINYYNLLSNNKVTNVKDIAIRYNTDENAKLTFNNFGNDLALVLEMVLTKFNAKNLILGGQIAKSYDLFKDKLEKIDINIHLSKDTSKSTLIGGKALFEF